MPFDTKGLRGHLAPRRAFASVWNPFRHRAFAVIWTATVVADVGTWMYNAASGWLMTDLNSDPLSVSLVQVVSNLPIFLLALPAGALADIIDKRRFLIVAESAATLVAAAFAVMVWLNIVTPHSLLLFMFLIGAANALAAPAWQAIVPQLVPSVDLAPAVAVNSVGVNISRAVGPALGGVLITALGMVAPFLLNAVSNLASVGALMWWRSPQKPAGHLPAERFISAMSTGIRHAQNNRHLRATLIRAVAFFLFASAYWALLPLVARNQLVGGPQLYGLLVGSIGAGAVGGASFLPAIKSKVGSDRIVAFGTVGTALALVLFGLARGPAVAIIASVIAGLSWIAVVAALNVSAQVVLPDWVRGRGLAIFVSAFFGAMTLGSAIWGEIASLAGLPTTQFIAAAGAILAIPLVRRWKLQTGAGIDLTPSMHWPTPVIAQSIEADRGPVLITVEYQIIPQHREVFLTAIDKLAHERRRDGAYAWGVFEDVTKNGRFLETFLVESWLEHLRQHRRVTNADRILEEHIRHLLRQTPTVTHLIAAEPVSKP
jgi:MFS family permease